MRLEKAGVTKMFWRSGKVQATVRRLKDLFDKAGRVGRCLNRCLDHSSLLGTFSYDQVSASGVQLFKAIIA